MTSLGDLCNLTVTTSARDECTNANTDSVQVRVDAIVPTVTCAVTLTELAPATQKMVNVGFSFTTSDNCDGSPGVQVFVTSDEPTTNQPTGGGPDFAPDASILRDLNGAMQGILLRAQASAQGDGRVYRIRVQAADVCGNVAFSDCFVSVRKIGGAAAIDSGQFYDATETN